MNRWRNRFRRKLRCPSRAHNGKWSPASRQARNQVSIRAGLLQVLRTNACKQRRHTCMVCCTPEVPCVSMLPDGFPVSQTAAMSVELTLSQGWREQPVCTPASAGSPVGCSELTESWRTHGFVYSSKGIQVNITQEATQGRVQTRSRLSADSTPSWHPRVLTGAQRPQSFLGLHHLLLLA